jgi:6-phosphogluconolactonase
MPHALYVCLQDDDKIAGFAIDDGGRLSLRSETAVAGGPSVMAIGPDGRTLYVGHRVQPAISSFRIDQGSGALTLLGTAATAHGPTFLALDRSGKYLLSAYYQGGYAAVHAIGADGAVGAPTAEPVTTANGAHAIATDPSNQFAFVPHIARLNDNVLEPPKNNPGPNVIYQFRFDAASGRLSPNTPAQLEPPAGRGPRHYTFHPSLDVAYFSNEQGCSVSAYRVDRTAGTLSEVQTIATLPAGFSERNTCSQIHLTASGRFLYVGNRGHNSVAGFSVDGTTGQLTAAGHAATEAVPSAFALDPEGRFLYAVGTATGRLASYRIDGATGALTALAVQTVGQRPAAVQAARLG